MLGIPHFGRSLEVNACVKNLLGCDHDGKLQLDEKVEITMKLISEIICLPIQGEDPKKLFSKENQKEFFVEVYDNYGTTRGGRVFLINMLNEDTIKFTTQLMECKLLRKCCKDQCPIAIIKVAECHGNKYEV